MQTLPENLFFPFYIQSSFFFLFLNDRHRFMSGMQHLMTEILFLLNLNQRFIILYINNLSIRF